ncbi:MAG: nuclear transport factor 2 family protein [Acidobacteria bacterium]|nr:nuclear transport factor 2 family protein [Acidobacteriota bacterium]
MKRILVMILFIMTTATFASGQCSDADRQKLEAWDKALAEAGRTGDRAFLQTAYADDFRALNPSGEMLTTTQTIENAVRNAERNKANPRAAPSNKYDFYDITCNQNTATISHRTATTTRQSGGKEQTNYSRSLHFLEKRGGNWVMVSSTGHALAEGAQLIYMQREWNEAEKNKDWAWFERNFADDFTFVSYGTGARQTKAEAIAGFKSSKTVYNSIEFSDLNSLVEGDMALVTGVLHLKGRDEKGQPLDHNFRFSDTAVKRDGRWQLLSSQGTRIQ